MSMNHVPDGAAVAMPGYTALMHRIRWRIFAFLFGFGFIAYLQQKSITVAAAQMMPELGLSQMQIGWIQWAFMLGYTCFQLPGGVLGQRLGARRMFIAISTLALLATLLTPLAPLALVGVSATFVGLFALRLVLGISQAAVFPVSSGVMEAWFRPERWALLQGLQVMGLQLAAALTPPLIAATMNSFGWQRALFWTSLPAAGVILLWAWYGRNTPAEHPAVTREELAELGDTAREVHAPISWRQFTRLLSDRSVALLTLSYTSMNYVFYLIGNWCFLYLIQERHFSILEGGMLAAAPPLAAALGAGLGGKFTTDLCARYGVRWGMRLVPLIALPVAGALLLLTVYASNPYVAVLALALCFGAISLTEGPYWAATMYVAREDSMTATGILNTGGNAGGLIGIPIVAYLSGNGDWPAVFVIGAVLAVVSALMWMGIDPTRRAARTGDSR